MGTGMRASTSVNGHTTTSALDAGVSANTAKLRQSAVKQERGRVQQEQEMEKLPLLDGSNSNSHTKLQTPQLDEMPGSLQNGTPSGSGYSTPVTRRRARREEKSRLMQKQKQQSNLIFTITAIPLAGMLIWNQLAPSSPHLSTEHTRTPSYHLSSIAAKCLHLSYQIPSSLFSSTPSGTFTSWQRAGTSNSSLYLKGPDDLYIVAYWVLLFTFFRESLIRFIWVPAARLGGIRKNSTTLRFAEQGYDLVTHSIAWSFGVYIMQQSEYRNLNIAGMWKGYPHFEMGGNLKLYYLIQAGFWCQQIITLSIEKRRKDFYHMVAHHIITVSLLYLSYIYNFTRIGNVILILMDVCDINLSTAKMLKYLRFEILCDVCFGVFMLMWIVTRHILYVRVLLSVIYDSSKYIDFGWDPENEYFWSQGTKTVFVVLLSALQVLLILWFFMIVKVAVAVLRGKPAEDSRSDDEVDSPIEEDSRNGSRSATPMSSPTISKTEKMR